MRYLPSVIAILCLSLTGCEKIKSWIEGDKSQPLAKRNTAESLGIATGDVSSYAEREPSPAAPAAAEPAREIRRTLTHRDGRTLDVILLWRAETTVRMRRVSDGVEFDYAIDNLSKEDREFIAQSGLARQN